MANDQTIWALEKFQKKLEKITSLRKSLANQECMDETVNRFSNDNSCSRKSSQTSLRRYSEYIPQSLKSSIAETNGFKKSVSFDGTAETEPRNSPSRKSSQRANISEQQVEMKTICECLTEFERCLLRKAKNARDKMKPAINTSQPVTDAVESRNEPKPSTSADGTASSERHPESSNERGSSNSELTDKPENSTQPNKTNENIDNENVTETRSDPSNNTSSADHQNRDSNQTSETRSNAVPTTNEPSSSESSIQPPSTPLSPSSRKHETSSAPPSATEQQSKKSIPETPILQPSTTDSSNVPKQDLESLLQTIPPRGQLLTNQSSLDLARNSPIIRPCDSDLTEDNAICRKKLEEKLDRMYELKLAYFSSPEDDIPFIDPDYPKGGVFIDEPIQDAFVYGTNFTKRKYGETSPREILSLSSVKVNQSLHCSPSKSKIIDENDGNKECPVFQKQSPNQWMDQIFEQTEKGMIEKVLSEFERKINKLSMKRNSSSSETSSIGEQYQSRRQIDIPNRSFDVLK